MIGCQPPLPDLVWGPTVDAAHEEPELPAPEISDLTEAGGEARHRDLVALFELVREIVRGDMANPGLLFRAWGDREAAHGEGVTVPRFGRSANLTGDIRATMALMARLRHEVDSCNLLFLSYLRESRHTGSNRGPADYKF
jgi:hypothetical protein